MTPSWGPLPAWSEWKDTLTTLHLWTQVVGKLRVACAPWVNHSWSVVQYVTPRGLTTGLVPHGRRAFQVDLDLVRHRLETVDSEGGGFGFDLEDGLSVAGFLARVQDGLAGLDLAVAIDRMPNELPDPIRFDRDDEHATYVGDHARALHRALLDAERVFQRFRAGYVGKSSPVHFFWGSFDLAVTRFAGRPAPPHPGGIPNLPDRITREAYSREVSSAGFWPGSADEPPFFYSYTYPTPEGFSDATVAPDGARWHDGLGEFVLPYDAVRTAPDPDEALAAFLQTTYVAAAEALGWDRAPLERTPGPPTDD